MFDKEVEGARLFLACTWFEHQGRGLAAPARSLRAEATRNLYLGDITWGGAGKGLRGGLLRVTLMGKHALLPGFFQRGKETLFTNCSSCPQRESAESSSLAGVGGWGGGGLGGWGWEVKGGKKRRKEGG